MRSPRTASVALVALASLALLAGCVDHDPTAHVGSLTSELSPSIADPALDVALSRPHEDSVYPAVGDPSVDALHYGLDLSWSPDAETLTGRETLVFRSTATTDHVQLDLSPALLVSRLSLDDSPVPAGGFEHRGKDLVVDGAFVADHRYELAIDYSGTPKTYPAPTTRSDIPALGFTIDSRHQTWTLQEPYGAFTWYAVNDQPSDKALYDLDLHVPAPWSGVSNGTVARDATTGPTDHRVHSTAWHLDQPAASYLVTLAFGDYTETHDVGPHGLPLTYWVPRQAPDHDRLLARLRTMPAALAFLERYLGPYPFSSAGAVVVDSDSAMETQTMVTLGDTGYVTSAPIILHELAHQWYGDEVTPSDWRDLWMSEGMAMYLQLMDQARLAHLSMPAFLRGYRGYEHQSRATDGPPADYDPARFGEYNVYIGPVFMWQALREQIGDTAFFALVRAWPEHAAAQGDLSTDRDTFLAFVEQQTGLDLDSFWHAWLLGRTTPRGRAARP